MRSPIAALGVATALALACVPQAARANGVDDICVMVTVSGVVNGAVGRCEPTTVDMEELRVTVGEPGGVLYVEVFVTYP